MFPYIAIVVTIIFFLLLSSAHVVDSGKVGLVVVAAVLSTVAGFRAMSVGTDTRTYSTMFYWIAGCSDLSSAFTVSTINAPVYVFYAWVLGRLGLSHQALLLFNAIVTNVGIAIFAKRTSNNPLIPILIYFCLGMYFQSLNGMRQYVAIALAINAYLDFFIMDFENQEHGFYSSWRLESTIQFLFCSLESEQLFTFEVKVINEKAFALSVRLPLYSACHSLPFRTYSWTCSRYILCMTVYKTSHYSLGHTKDEFDIYTQSFLLSVSSDFSLLIRTTDARLIQRKLICYSHSSPFASLPELSDSYMELAL